MCYHDKHNANNGQAAAIPVQRFIHAIADLALSRLNDEDKTKAGNMFLTYGVGRPNLRGVTYYDAWESEGEKMPFVEICAAGQSDSVQLAGTTIHEIGHVLAGWSAGHGKEWKEACAKLGLNGVKAAGTIYTIELFSDDIREEVQALIDQLDKSEPAFRRVMQGGKPASKVKPAQCPQSVGVRGGKSRGTGSGSRMLKFECTECQAVWRMAGKWADSVTQCPCCKSEQIIKPEST